MARRGPGTVVVGVSIFHEQAEAMRASATQNDRSVSAEFRRAIREYLAAQAASEKKMSPDTVATARGSAIAVRRDAVAH